MFTRTLATVLSALCLTTTLAQDKTIILHEGNNELPSYAAVTATFTPETDCKVLIEAGDQYQVSYEGHDYTFLYVPTNSPANICEIDGVKANTTITLTSPFVMNPQLRITVFQAGQVIPLELTNVLPAQGTDRFWQENGILTLSFNKPVSLSAAEIQVANEHFPIEILHVSSAISLNVGTTLSQLLADGTLVPGKPFIVNITGLHEAGNDINLYNQTGKLSLRFPAPQPQYSLISASVNGQELYTSGLNDYTFLSYYSPDSEDGVFVFEFEHEIGSATGVVIQMGSRDMDGQGKYYEGPIPFTISGNKIIADARGTLRTLNILFPAVVEDTFEEGAEVTEGPGMGTYDTEHLTMRVSNVKDTNGNYFRAQQAGNLGTYSFYMNYKELMENINFDGDNKAAGESVVAGEELRLWLGSDNVTFDGIQVSYMTEVEEDAFEQRLVMVSDYTTEPDPFQGVIISFIIPEMPGVAVGQTVRVSLHNASSTDGMPHALSIDFKAGDPAGIHDVRAEQASPYVWTLNGLRIPRHRVAPGTLFIDPIR